MELFLITSTNPMSGKEEFLFDSSYCESYEYESGAYTVGDLMWDNSIESLENNNPIVVNKKQKDLIEAFITGNSYISEYTMIHGIKLSVFKDYLTRQRDNVQFKQVTI
jgi:hypothetical protein